MDLFQVFTPEEQAQATDALAEHRRQVEFRKRSFADRANQLRYQAMLDAVADWRPPELPCLDAFDHVYFNVETTGLRWYDADRVISGCLRTPDGREYYLPIRHRVGPNIAEETFFEWCRRELRGKRIINIRTKFDLHMMRREGVDLEALGCTFADVHFYAGLLDDRRKRFNLDLLAYDMLGWDVTKDPLGKIPFGILSEGEFQHLPAGVVAPYGCRNVEQVAQLDALLRPQLRAQQLEEVAAIEDAVIPAVVEMEHNGCPLDVDLLNKWCGESAAEVDDALLQIKHLTGLDIEKTSNAYATRLFNHLNIPIPWDPESVQKGDPRPSFADALIRDITHPAVLQFRRAAQLKSLRSKFLLKYQAATARDGILRYELHQMPYQDDKEEGGGGAVTGRFSSAACTYFDADGMKRREGANVQQVMGGDTQKKKRPFTAAYPIKRLFRAQRGVVVNADASQLQFREFAHYANDPNLIKAYARDWAWREIDARAAAKRAAGIELTKDDKLTDFHESVGELMERIAEVIETRTHVKNVNFAQVFGAGVPKMAEQLGCPADQIPSYAEWGEAVKNGSTHSIGGPDFQKAVHLSETYHELFPTVKPMLKLTSHLAMPSHAVGRERACGRACREFYAQGYPHRGWVRTIKGRRARFKIGDRYYSALNRVIQGSEGDIMKIAMVDVHEHRKELGLTERIVVHDSFMGDLEGDPRAFKELLNRQRLDLRVPILFDVGCGPTWAEAK